MIRFAAMLCLVMLPVAAAAQNPGALGPMPAPRSDRVAEPMSRAQVAQLVADRGYFEVDGLTRQEDGSWTCTALVGPGKRVALTIRGNGVISEKDLPQDGGR
jgi:hypothetical protein